MVLRDVVGLVELLGGQAGRETDGGETGGFGGGNTGGRIFDGAALTGSESEFASGGEIDFGIGFVVLDGIATDGNWKILREAGYIKNDINDDLVGAGSHGELIFFGERRNEFVKFLVNRPVLPDEPVEVLQLARMERGRWFGLRMVGEKIAKQNGIRNANITSAIDAVILRVAEFGKKCFPSFDVQRFAVDNHAVHVKDDTGKRLIPQSAGHSFHLMVQPMA